MENLDNTKTSILEELKKKRSKLSDNSLKTYISCLNSIYKKLNGTNGIEFFTKERKTIIQHLKDIEPNKRKTLLSALFIITDIPEYKDIMLKDCSIINTKYKEQKMSQTEKENWVMMKEIREKYGEYFKMVNAMFSHKAVFDDRIIIEFFILALMSGVAGIPPRRSLDYSLMRIRNFNKEKDNYYDKGKMVFNVYKTAKTYGRITINVKEMAPELNTLLKKWVQINPTDYLLYSSNDKPLSPSQIAKHNNKIWDGKKVSCDIYRHSFLTDYYKNDRPTYIQMEDMAKLMGHSISTALQYIKNDAPEPK